MLLPGVWMRVWWWVRVRVRVRVDDPDGVVAARRLVWVWWWVRVRVRVWVWVRVDEPDGVVAARRLDDTVEKGLGSGRSAG